MTDADAGVLLKGLVVDVRNAMIASHKGSEDALSPDDAADAFAKGMRSKKTRDKWRVRDYFDGDNRRRARKLIGDTIAAWDEKAAEGLKADIPNDRSTGDTQGGSSLANAMPEPP